MQIGSAWGEVNSNVHRALGCVGTITDGAIRDVDEMTNAGFKALARRLCVGHAYSVPVRWAHHPVVAKGYWQEVRLYAQGQEVAQHGRIWEREQVRFEPLHYLALLERKPGALDHARPLAGWSLPE